MTVIESIMLTIFEEIAVVTKIGKFGWQQFKSIFGFDSQMIIKELGDLGKNIAGQVDKWEKANQIARSFESKRD